MARAYSQDLRDRVIDAALSGLPARHAAARFGVGVATAIVWVRRFRESGERQARKQGQPRRSKLDPHRDYRLERVAQTPDLTISELLDRLAAERDMRASRATLWTFLDRCGLTFKKDRPCERAGSAGHPEAAAESWGELSPQDDRDESGRRSSDHRLPFVTEGSPRPGAICLAL